ncbi:aminoglycoside phosphotransferase family protein [Microbacterium hominis]|uniref:Aminoglycoside phosphotransferase family protein n=1 Tax=Microbacterium hominis TaxID=162426 RepID=A0A7D4UI00_9MICO|nr:aminoglycoside phosphotransferase family protein [Microbacterium hominis]QKJ19108.1 aminoglycoside phosphotransferase family protein [Microbacterium hominis]
MREPHRRMPWDQLPATVRHEIGALLGSPVVSARSQPGGFSPGSADLVMTADGRRAFVKTAHAGVNAQACDIHRREAVVTARLPDGAPVTRLIGVVDLGDWVALAFEEIEGRQAREPWDRGELDAALDAYAHLSSAPPASHLDAVLGDLSDEVAVWASAWDGGGLARSDATARLGPGVAHWVSTRADDLAGLAARAPSVVGGDRLVHWDGRADNVLIRPDGTAVIIDWPWALRGAPWVDPLLLLANARLSSPELADAALAHPTFAEVPPHALDALLAAVAGGMLANSLQPPVPGIPTLRAFQFEQAAALLSWLRERRGLGASWVAPDR